MKLMASRRGVETRGLALNARCVVLEDMPCMYRVACIIGLAAGGGSAPAGRRASADDNENIVNRSHLKCGQAGIDGRIDVVSLVAICAGMAP